MSLSAITCHVATRVALSTCLLTAVAVSTVTTTQHAGARADGVLSVTVCVPTPTLPCPIVINPDGVQMWD
jgi:hypothetical protein